MGSVGLFMLCTGPPSGREPAAAAQAVAVTAVGLFFACVVAICVAALSGPRQALLNLWAAGKVFFMIALGAGMSLGAVLTILLLR
jgi:hypothetical protein